MHLVKRLVIVLAMLCVVLSVQAEVEGLLTLRNTYKDQMNKIDDEEMVAIATLQAQYISALAALEKDFQLKGKLDPLLKAKEERERFSVARSLEEGDISSGVADIDQIQKQFIAGMNALPLEPSQKKLTLAGFYERSLKNLEAELTRNNDIAGAIEVKKEREGLESRDEIVRARAVLEKVSRPALAEPQAESVIEVPAVEGPKEPEAAEVDRVKIANQVKMRFNKFMDAVADQDWDEALKFVDPSYVKENGEGIATDVLKMKYSMARHIADNPSSKIRSGDIEVKDNGKRVTLTPEIWANNRSRTLEKMKWVLGPEDGEWYLSLPANFGDKSVRPKTPRTAPRKWRK